jgi:hypothetical protein
VYLGRSSPDAEGTRAIHYSLSLHHRISERCITMIDRVSPESPQRLGGALCQYPILDATPELIPLNNRLKMEALCLTVAKGRLEYSSSLTQHPVVRFLQILFMFK